MFVGVKNNVDGCPKHEPHNYAGLEFFQTFEDVVEWQKKSLPYCYLFDLWDVDTKAIKYFTELNYENHNISYMRLMEINSKVVGTFKPDPYGKNKWLYEGNET